MEATNREKGRLVLISCERAWYPLLVHASIQLGATALPSMGDDATNL